MEWIERLHGTVVGLDTAPVTNFAAEAARIRATSGLKTPEALQIASASTLPRF